MSAHRTHAGDMGDIRHNQSPHIIGDLPHRLEVDGPGIAGCAHHNELGAGLSGDVCHLGVVEHLRLSGDVIRDDLVHLA